MPISEKWKQQHRQSEASRVGEEERRGKERRAEENRVEMCGECGGARGG